MSNHNHRRLQHSFKKRIGLLLQILEENYPDPKSELIFENSFQLIVSVLLSAQCTDKKVNQVTPTLFSNFPSFQALARAELDSIEKIIRPINYYRTKARNLISLGKTIVESHNGEVPLSHSQLIELPGVGNKTANVVLGELGAAKTLPVDTHVFRVSKRLGLSEGKDVCAVELQLRDIFDPDTWRSLHHWLILHGRRVCVARNPKCTSCALAELCPRIGV